MGETYKSRVYTERPAYADYEPPQKFMAIQSIIGRRLREHPNAICSYSGGSDSDIMIDVIEKARDLFKLPPVKYVFFNTGLEMKATKDHVKETAQKYGVEIEEVRPKVNIVNATRKYGVPFSYKAVEDLELIKPFEPNVVKAAWNIFGKSYLYRKKYIEYKERKKRTEIEKNIMKLKIYIAGKITGDPDYEEKFKTAAREYENRGYIVLNPAMLPEGMLPSDYMRICLSMIDTADIVAFLPGYETSQGAQLELQYCMYTDKSVWLPESRDDPETADKLEAAMKKFAEVMGK